MQGVLAIDPSWRGMGWVMYAGPCITASGVSDITKATRKYDQYQKTIPLVQQWFVEEVWPHIHYATDLIDTVVIESQFHVKMKNLLMIVASCVHQYLPHAQLKFVSALTCKRSLSVPYSSSHNQNKKEALKYVRDNAETLLSGFLHRDNDNTADAILLLNYQVSTRKKNRFPETDMSYQPNQCPKCHTQTVYLNVTKKAGPNQGRPFASCKNPDCKTFLWTDTLSKPLHEALADLGQPQQPSATLGKRTQRTQAHNAGPPKRPAVDVQAIATAIHGLRSEIQLIRQLIQEQSGAAAKNWSPPPDTQEMLSMDDEEEYAENVYQHGP